MPEAREVTQPSIASYRCGALDEPSLAHQPAVVEPPAGDGSSVGSKDGVNVGRSDGVGIKGARVGMAVGAKGDRFVEVSSGAGLGISGSDTDENII